MGGCVTCFCGFTLFYSNFSRPDAPTSFLRHSLVKTLLDDGAYFQKSTTLLPPCFVSFLRHGSTAIDVTTGNALLLSLVWLFAAAQLALLLQQPSVDVKSSDKRRPRGGGILTKLMGRLDAFSTLLGNILIFAWPLFPAGRRQLHPQPQSLSQLPPHPKED